jgi:DNA-binding transcriptional MerR regulator
VSEVTLDELARLTGTTGRNIRAFQTQGLVPRPRLVGRRGLYGPEHLVRVRAILRLQDEGFSLGSIAVLLRALDDGVTLEQLVGVEARAEAHALDVEDELFVGWPSLRSGQLLWAVPSNLIALPAA